MTSLLRALALVALCAPAAAHAQNATSRDTLRMVFVGDINFARSLARDFIFTGRGERIFAGVRDRLRAADIAVANLESQIIDRGRYSDPPGSPVFAGPVAALPLLLDAGFDAVGTANNHSWDFGRAGLLESLEHLGRFGLPNTGTGATIGDAWRPVVFRVKGWTIAMFSLTYIFNHESMTVIGQPAECCVAWADTLRAAERFRAVRDSLGADVVVAFVHAGLEYIPVPPADVRAVFRGLARAGADAVIGHHPHVPQGLEHVGGVPVLYSLGNFVFHQTRPWTNRGLWAELTLLPDGRRQLDILPLVVGYTPAFATGADSARVMAHFEQVSRRLARLPEQPSRRNLRRPQRP